MPNVKEDPDDPGCPPGLHLGMLGLRLVCLIITVLQWVAIAAHPGTKGHPYLSWEEVQATRTDTCGTSVLV